MAKMLTGVEVAVKVEGVVAVEVVGEGVHHSLVTCFTALLHS